MKKALQNNHHLELFGFKVLNLKSDQLIKSISNTLLTKEKSRIEGLNVAKLVDAQSNQDLANAINQAEIVHIDGAGIYLGSKFLGVSAEPSYPGIDLMIDIIKICVSQRKSIYLLGGSKSVISEAANKFSEQFPDLIIAGYRDGYFDESDEESIVQEINNSGAEVLFVGISSPKKELFIQRRWKRLQVILSMGVGGSFDVVAGKVSRAPKYMRKIHMEWLFRLLQEPRRLMWRYLYSNTYFFLLVIKSKLLTKLNIKKQKVF